uniref:glutaminase n=2 Tax=Panagrolaimus superbus TaxID=310955 RepID=A0A914YTF0_9BILA
MRPHQDNRKHSTDEMRKFSTISLGTFNQAIDQLERYIVKRELPAEEMIYNIFKLQNRDEANIGKLIALLRSYGLLESDPRLKPMIRKILKIEDDHEIESREIRDPKKWKLEKEEFMICVNESLGLITRALQNELIIPSWQEFCQHIKDIFLKCRDITDGKVATYIPQLSRVDPNKWGVSICTVDGQRASWGDCKEPFCFQSISKAFNYAIAASELGADVVHSYVGQEPSGRLFNEICLDNNDKPHNPMVNSGAIIVTALINNKLNLADRFDSMINAYRQIAGGEYIGFNNAVFLSERQTADRNYALSYYMKEKKCFPPETTNLTDALDFYFQLCSLETNCEALSVMAATLANGGVCPITEERCVKNRPCRDVLSLMNSCGMYDYSGQFSFHVGLPAKSGVSGNLMIVIPNLVGIAIWSPPLDLLGNSVRGVAFCKELITRFNFHTYDSLANNESEKFDPRKRVGDREKNQVVTLLFASKAGDINSIRRMFLKGVDLEMEDYDRRTALHLAAAEGHLDVVIFLVKVAKVRVDPKDRWNRTPLQDAKSQKHHNVIAFLRQAMAIGEQEEDANDEVPVFDCKNDEGKKDDVDDDFGNDISYDKKNPGSQNLSPLSCSTPKSLSESSDDENNLYSNDPFEGQKYKAMRKIGNDGTWKKHRRYSEK